MKKFKKILVTATGLMMGLVLLAGKPVNAANAEISSGVENSLVKAYTDETEIKNYYVAVMEKFGEVVPFVNIAKAEENHINAVERQMKIYNMDIPEITTLAAQVPATLEEAIEIAIELEREDIAFYETELQKELPSNVQRVYNNLLRGSQSHLKAFERDREDCVNPDGNNPQRKNQKAIQGNRRNADNRTNGNNKNQNLRNCDTNLNRMNNKNPQKENNSGGNTLRRNQNNPQPQREAKPQRQNNSQGAGRSSQGQGINRNNRAFQ